MPFFLKAEAGSAVSDLLDERLKRLEQQMDASDKACEGLSSQVLAFNKGTREMCRGAGNAVSAFGLALQVDSTRIVETATILEAIPKSHAHVASTSEKAAGGEVTEAEKAALEARRKTGSMGNREPLRAELLALQLNECASEMEDHLRVQVLQPVARMQADRSDIQAAVRKRSRAADNLAAAHVDYARVVARCQPSGDNISAGPPSDVVLSGDRVVEASDALAEAHGLAEEVLSGLLEERGRCLREAMSSLKAAQAGFFVRASRCISSSVGPEPLQTDIPVPAADKHCAVFKAEGAGVTPITAVKSTFPRNASTPGGTPRMLSMPPAPAIGAAVATMATVDTESHTESEQEITSRDTRTVAFTTATSDKLKGKVKWRKASDREGSFSGLNGQGPRRSQTEFKRRRSSGWFKRLTSSFQSSSNRQRSASDELLGGVQLPSSSSEAVADSSEDSAERLCASGLRVPPGPVSATLSLCVTEDVSEESDAPWHGSGDSDSERADPSRTAESATGTEVIAGSEAPREPVSTARLAESGGAAQEGGEETQEGGKEAQEGSTPVGGAEAETEEEEEEEDSDGTGSNTTEGFGSDDAGDLWDGRRVTMGTFDRVSPLMSRDDSNNKYNDNHGAVEAGDIDAAAGDTRDGTEMAVAAVAEEGGSEGTAGEEKGEEVVEVLLEPGTAARTGNVVPDLDDGDGAPLTPAKDLKCEKTLGASGSLSSVGVDKLEEVGEKEAPEGTVEEHNGVSDGEEHEDEDNFSATAAALFTPASPHFLAAARSLTPASVLPASPDETTVGSPMPAVLSTPEQQPLSPLPKLNSSPAISDTSSSKESPRAWRLSWWARASDRHRPPPPAIGDDEEIADAVAGTSLATALAAAAGKDEVETTLPTSGAFAPTLFSGNGGDAPAVDGGQSAVGEEENAAADAVAVAAIAVVVAAERRTRSHSRRRRRRGRLNKPWLTADKLVDAQARALEAASEYMDVTDLGRASGVCRGWGARLRGRMEDDGRARREWMRCVRQADGVPNKFRARFYMHVLYDEPAWVPKVHQSTSLDRPRPNVYRECVLRADAEEEEARRAAEALLAGTEGAGDESLLEGTRAPTQEPSNADGESLPTPPARCYKWLEEIDTDVLRTCPADAVDEFDRTIEATAATSRRRESLYSTFGTPPATKSSGDVKAASALAVAPILSSSCDRREGGIDEVVLSRGSDGEGPIHPSTPTRPLYPTEEEGGSSLGLVAGSPTEAAGGAGGGVGVVSSSVESEEGASLRRRELGGTMESVIGGGTREKLRRVLRAFAVYNRRISYCQGMNFVALALLEACDGDDENAFWILAGMCDRHDLEGLWCQGLERLDLCFFSLDRLLRRHCPSLRQHLSDEGVELSMFTSRWFVTLFTCTDVFGRGTSRKILDMFMVEGWPLLFKLSLGVLLEMRPLIEPADMEGILKVTKFPRAQLFGLRRDGTGRRVAGATFEEASQGSLCESIRAGQMVEHALLLHVTEETLEEHLVAYRLQKLPDPGSD